MILHQTTIEEDEDGWWRTSCLCGWVAFYDTRAEAEHDFHTQETVCAVVPVTEAASTLVDEP